MPKHTTHQLTKKLSEATLINDEDEKYTLEYKGELVDQVNDGIEFIKKMEPFLKGLKKDLKPMISYKSA